MPRILLTLRYLALAFVLGSVASPLNAQAARITAIRADRLVVGDGTFIDRPVVLVQGDRFLAVGPAASTPIPTGARIIDLAGHTLLPGLIDAHTHINSSDSDGGDMAVLRETGAHAAIYGVVNARKTLDAGFTTIRDVGATNGADIALRDLIAKGVVPGPRLFAAGPSLGITGGHADVNGGSPLVTIPGTGLIVDGVEEMRKAVRQNVKYGSDHIKITATGGILSVGDAVDHAQYSEEELRVRLRAAWQGGVKFAFGTDATGDIHGRNAEEFVLMQAQLGATPMAAIRSATSAAADLIGVADQLGTVSAGKLADLIAVEGNPLDDLRRMQRVPFVMKAGDVYKGAAVSGAH